MANGNWFDDWINEIEERLRETVKQFGAFFHRGIQVAPSGRWKRWYTFKVATTCIICDHVNGTVLDAKDPNAYPTWLGITIIPPVHEKCRCMILPLPAMKAGTATIHGVYGANWYIFHLGVLPPIYITKEEAENLGWINKKGNLDEVAPGAMIGGEIFWNGNGKLPDAPGRVWYEADINYTRGYRGEHRVLYSNDGLVFVSYDHYETFYEIIP